MSSIGNFIKQFDKHEEYYNRFTEIISKLQPMAFLISASLVLAVFFENNSISQKYALFASLLFFFAYLGFVFYKIANYGLFFYWGLSLTLLGVIFIYNSFGDVLAIILSINNNIITTLIFYIICSMMILFTQFSLDCSRQNNLRYKISNIAFYIIFLFILIYVPLLVYLNLTFFPILIAILLLILISYISLSKFNKIG